MAAGAFNWKGDTYQQLWSGQVPLNRVYAFYGFVVPLGLVLIGLALHYMVAAAMGEEAAFYGDRVYSLGLVVPYHVLLACIVISTGVKYKGLLLWRLLAFVAGLLLLVMSITYGYGEFMLFNMGYADFVAWQTQWQTLLKDVQP